MGALAAWLSGVVATFLASSVARWLAWKVIISLIVLTILPIILNNVIYDLIDTVQGLVTSHSGSIAPWVGSFTGLTAWLLQQTRMPECLSIIIAACSIRYVLGLIPFVRA